MKVKRLVLFAILPALAGFLIGFIRYTIFSKFYDAEFDILSIASRNWENGLLIFCALCFILIWLLSKMHPREHVVNSAPWNSASKMLLTVSALAFAASGVYTYTMSTPGIITTISAVFLIFCAVCVAYLPHSSGSISQFLVVVPIFMYIFELFVFFKLVGENPHVFRYSFEILTVVSALFLAYASGAFLFCRGTASKLLTTYGATVLLMCAIFFGNLLIKHNLGITQLIDTHYMLSMTALIIYATAFCKALAKPKVVVSEDEDTQEIDI